jgi:hypothetical protein
MEVHGRLVLLFVEITMMSRSAIPVELSQKIRDVGRMWAASETRPRLDLETMAHWDSLIRAWADSDLPLVVRKSGGVRGGVSNHSSGRKIVLADNSPAQWAFGKAFGGLRCSLSDIRTFLDRDEVPFAMVRTKTATSQAAFKCTLASLDNLNQRGWKLCHIDSVGLKSRICPEQLPLETLVRHFCKLLSPSNHFLVPLAWAGLGELPEIVDEIRKYQLSEVVLLPRAAISTQ